MFHSRLNGFRPAQCLVLLCLFVSSARSTGGEQKEQWTTPEVERTVDGLLRSGKCDISVFSAIRALPKAERPALARKLIKSSHPAMRHHAMLILQGFPPEEVKDSIRELLGDKSYENRLAAALYLARAAKDADARSLILKSAKSRDPRIAVLAVKSLGTQLTGPDVDELLKDLLEEIKTPTQVLVAVIRSVGGARTTECGDALAKLLDNQARLDVQRRGGDLRVCDLAAWALEAIYKINSNKFIHTGIFILHRPGCTTIVSMKNIGRSSKRSFTNDPAIVNIRKI